MGEDSDQGDRDPNDTIYYQGDYLEKKKKYLKMTPEEQEATKPKGDDIDKVELFQTDSEEEEKRLSRVMDLN